MTSFQSGIVERVAEVLTGAALSPEAAQTLAPHIDVLLREIVQEAFKFARHAKRTRLSTDDINHALQARNVEPTYGFQGRDPSRFVRAAGHAGLFVLLDPKLSVKELLGRPLPKPPVEVGVVPHWLAIDGEQPNTPENAPLAAAKKGAKRAAGEELERAAKRVAVEGSSSLVQAPVTQPGKAEVIVRPPVRHHLSAELQKYLEAITAVFRAAGELPAEAAPLPSDHKRAWGSPLEAPLVVEQDRRERAVLASLATDPGLHPLLPYLVNAVEREVKGGLRGPLPPLRLSLKVTRALLQNSHLRPDHYLHQLLPLLLTLTVASGLGPPSQQAPTRLSSTIVDHWALRNEAAAVTALVCARFGSAFGEVQARVCRQLAGALADPRRPLATHYGAVVGLAALGHRVTRLLLLPLLGPYMHSLASAILSHRRDMTPRGEAERVRGAMLHAAASCLLHSTGPKELWPVVANTASAKGAQKRLLYVKPDGHSGAYSLPHTDWRRAAEGADWEGDVMHHVTTLFEAFGDATVPYVREAYASSLCL